MLWSKQQEDALDAVGRWLRRGDKPVFKVFGYAGTGKTTLAKHFAASLGHDSSVLFGAYTGKAALVLRKKGCPNASTIHQMIYLPQEKGQSTLRALLQEFEEISKLENPSWQDQIRRERLDFLIQEERTRVNTPHFRLNHESDVLGASLVVIDECSMVDKEMGEDLLSFGAPILVLGDPAQLPPVGGGGFFTNGQPDVMLTEVHRQAQDSPVLRLATQVRTGQRLQRGSYGSSAVLPPGTLTPDVPLSHDQILVGRNATRHHVNQRMRNIKGLDAGGQLVPGDKLVCLRNDHSLGLLNGSLWTVAECLDNAADTEAEHVLITVKNDENIEITVPAWRCFLGQQPPQMSFWERKEAQEFDYGYALTVHKAQGSQWESVLIFDESQKFSESNRWLYTAITRASERVTIVAVE